MKEFRNVIIFTMLALVCCLTTVFPVQAKADVITLNYKNLTMQVGDKVDFNISDGSFVKSSEKVTWTSSDKKVAAVDKNGIVTAKKVGTATITAKIAGKKEEASCKVTVRKKSQPKTKVLVVYFSATNTTKGVAEKIADVTGGDLYRITPAKAYSAKDIDYNDDGSRTTKEQNNKNSRPQLKGKSSGIGNYDIVFLGYPIWWGQAPRIISTFLESYDFSGKTIIPFCTSGSSGIGSSATNLQTLVSGSAVWKDGRRFGGGTAKDEVAAWISSLGL